LPLRNASIGSDGNGVVGRVVHPVYELAEIDAHDRERYAGRDCGAVSMIKRRMSSHVESCREIRRRGGRGGGGVVVGMKVGVEVLSMLWT